MKNESGKRTMTGHYQKVDIGIVVCAGYYLSKKIKLEVRYNYGLSKVTRQFFNYDFSGRGYDTSGFNRSLQFDVDYIF